MIIRAEQLRAFRPAAEELFERRLVRYLRDEHGEEIVLLPEGEFGVEDIPDGTLVEMIRPALRRARGYGMKWESTLTAFVVLTFVAAPNFDSHPLIRRVLEDETVAPDERIERLWETTTDEIWEMVEVSYDAGAWQLEADRGTGRGSESAKR